MKSDSKSFFAYVRSKLNVRDKVGPLEDNAGNIITQGVLMADELYMHSSSVSTQEDTSSLPVPETKFEGSEGERFRWSEKWQMLFNFGKCKCLHTASGNTGTMKWDELF